MQTDARLVAEAYAMLGVINSILRPSSSSSSSKLAAKKTHSARQTHTSRSLIPYKRPTALLLAEARKGGHLPNIIGVTGLAWCCRCGQRIGGDPTKDISLNYCATLLRRRDCDEAHYALIAH